MFEHSIKVPRIYKISAKFAKDAAETGKSIKTLIANERHNKKGVYALLCTLFQQFDRLEYLIEKTGINSANPRFDPWLTKVLVVELLWGKKRLSGESKPIRTVLSYEKKFRRFLTGALGKTKEKTSVENPRYARVNTLKISVEKAIKLFESNGWKFVHLNNIKNYVDFLNRLNKLQSNEFIRDIHVKDLLIFPSKANIQDHIAVENGLIVLQNKANCIPVLLLDPKPENIVLDMCAAPGIKTSQIAANLNNKGKVIAVDRDKTRLTMLKDLMKKYDVNCIEIVHKDILNINDTLFPNVELVLIDPPCSNTGIVNSTGLITQQKFSKEKIQKLFGIQVMMLKQAFRHYHKAKRIVYSTCSVLVEENENVVSEVITNCNGFKLLNANKLLPNWDNFGSELYGDIGKRCVYTRPERDRTNGVFVAVFERLKDDEVNEFLKPQNCRSVAKKRKIVSSRIKLKNLSNTTKSISKTIIKDVLKNRPKKKKKKMKSWASIEVKSENKEFQENSITNSTKNVENKKKERKHKNLPMEEGHDFIKKDVRYHKKRKSSKDELNINNNIEDTENKTNIRNQKKRRKLNAETNFNDNMEGKKKKLKHKNLPMEEDHRTIKEDVNDEKIRSSNVDINIDNHIEGTKYETHVGKMKNKRELNDETNLNVNIEDKKKKYKHKNLSMEEDHKTIKEGVNDDKRKSNDKINMDNNIEGTEYEINVRKNKNKRKSNETNLNVNIEEKEKKHTHKNLSLEEGHETIKKDVIQDKEKKSLNDEMDLNDKIECTENATHIRKKMKKAKKSTDVNSISFEEHSDIGSDLIEPLEKKTKMNEYIKNNVTVHKDLMEFLETLSSPIVESGEIIKNDVKQEKHSTNDEMNINDDIKDTENVTPIRKKMKKTKKSRDINSISFEEHSDIGSDLIKALEKKMKMKKYIKNNVTVHKDLMEFLETLSSPIEESRETIKNHVKEDKQRHSTNDEMNINESEEM